MARLGLWHRDRAHVSTYTTLWRLIQETPNVRTILDIPSGEGRFASRLAEAGYVTTAADIRDVGEIAGCSVARADMNRELPWPDATFDAVLSIEGIEHIISIHISIAHIRIDISVESWRSNAQDITSEIRDGRRPTEVISHIFSRYPSMNCFITIVYNHNITFRWWRR